MESGENNVDQKHQDATEDDADAQGSLGPVVQQCEWQKHQNQDGEETEKPRRELPAREENFSRVGCGKGVGTEGTEKKSKSRKGCNHKERQDRQTGEPGGR